MFYNVLQWIQLGGGEVHIVELCIFHPPMAPRSRHTLKLRAPARKRVKARRRQSLLVEEMPPEVDEDVEDVEDVDVEARLRSSFATDLG